MTQISAKIIADSKNIQGDRITTMQVTFPRYILAELNTHRMFSRNSASSRAIPFEKMVESVEKNPFIPIAWQKDHSGMQGTEYFTEETEIKVNNHMWMEALWNSTRKAKHLHESGVTKQFCNRLLEPYMWHTVLITATEWENFFNLRCPNYIFHNDECKYDQHNEGGEYSFKSRKDAITFFDNNETVELNNRNILLKDLSNLEWLQANYGQADIHMMALAEAMWDAMNESTPKELKEGEWHIPFGNNVFEYGTLEKLSDKIFEELLIKGKSEYHSDELLLPSIKIATARCARVSYTVVGEEDKESNYENDIKLHDKLLESGHFSPFEHCAKAMTEEEYELNVKGELQWTGGQYNNLLPKKEDQGWCLNFKGFIQYRELID